MEKRKWLVLNYNLPTEPSRHRVAAWRALKKLGSVNIQQSMWVLAFNDENYKAMKELAREIETNHGEALLMESVFFEQSHEERVVVLFNNIRSEEYMEFINECEKYLKELQKEITNEKFTFAELEEEESELEKLVSWHMRIVARDLFLSDKRQPAEEKLGEIKKAFENYNELVYSRNNQQ